MRNSDWRSDVCSSDLVTAAHGDRRLDCVLVDEAQFLTQAQVWQLARLADAAGIPVLCYGLWTDFQGELFPCSAALLGIADALVELMSVCHCGISAERTGGTECAIMCYSQVSRT